MSLCPAAAKPKSAAASAYPLAMAAVISTMHASVGAVVACPLCPGNTESLAASAAKCHSERSPKVNIGLQAEWPSAQGVAAAAGDLLSLGHTGQAVARDMQWAWCGKGT